ncbi:hypothetical protein [Flammeovirga sp. SJP92]|uniref:hypothetical protein n=1 Tax=Flammeovirga sp. SJP92 TaxID=1775430 RepID=UPI00079C2ABC|nr:hypothetical protein [Flammeovirga sp. SJP92]KXX70064.1 hypothetical protein AVL50_14415 [Flammeovirga sp. SJP92]
MGHDKYTQSAIRNLTLEQYQQSFDEIFAFALNIEDTKDQANYLSNLMAVSTQFIDINQWYDLLEEVLQFIEYPIPQDVGRLHRDLSLQQLRLLENIGENSITDTLTNLDRYELQESELGLKLMAPIALYARIENWEKFKWIALELVNHAIENGKSDVTALGCMALSKYMIARYESVPEAMEYAESCISFIEHTNDKWLLSRLKCDFATFIIPWATLTARSFEVLEQAFDLVKNTEDEYQKSVIKLRYLQYQVFCGYSLESAQKLLTDKFGDAEMKTMPATVLSLLQLIQLNNITREESKEKVIMILDNEPSLYEGNLLHPMLLLLKAVHLTTVSDDQKNNLDALRRILDRFKYWAGYSNEVFQGWVFFMEAEWRWESKEFDKSDQLYSSAFETIAIQQSAMKCLIKLRQLSQWVKKEGKTERTLSLFQTTLKQYEIFGDAEATIALKDRFKTIFD